MCQYKILLWNSTSDTGFIKIIWPMQMYLLGFHVPCYNTKSNKINSIPTGKRHGCLWDANSKLPTGKVQYAKLFSDEKIGGCTASVDGA